MSDLNMQIVVKAIDKATRPFSKIIGITKKLNGKLAGLSRTQSKTADQTEKANRALDRQRRQLERVSKATDRLKRARKQLDKAGKISGKTAIAGGVAGGVAYGTARLVDSFLEPVKAIEAARGELASLGMDHAGQNTVVKMARDTSLQIAGLTAESFVTAAYDIKSGISSLNAEGVASMTRAAAMTAKATKSMPETMTSLFATGYGIFKRQFADKTDTEFGELFSASIAKAVQNFKTTGGKMQQAIQSAGGMSTNLGMSFADQLTALGMMQTSMEAGDAGTSLRAFSENAARAQEAFDQLGNGVQVLNDQGQLRGLADIMGDLKAAYGDTLDAFEGREIQKAFGTQEAMKLISNLWGMEEAFKAQSAAMTEAGAQGIGYTRAMVNATQNNFAARWALNAQKIRNLQESIGRALLPTVEALISKIGPIVTRLANWISENQGLATTIGTVVIAIGGIAAILSPILLTVSSLVGSIAMAKFAFAGLGLGAIKLIPIFQGVIGVLGVLKAVALANPITAIIAGIAMAAALVIANWDTVKAFFLNIWEPIKPYWQKFAGWIGQIWDTISAPFKAIQGLFGGDQQQPVPSKIPQTMRKAATVTAVSSMVAVAQPAAAIPVQQHQVTQPVQISANFTINADRETDVSLIRQEVEKALDELQRRLEARRAAALHD